MGNWLGSFSIRKKILFSFCVLFVLLLGVGGTAVTRFAVVGRQTAALVETTATKTVALQLEQKFTEIRRLIATAVYGGAAADFATADKLLLDIIKKTPDDLAAAGANPADGELFTKLYAALEKFRTALLSVNQLENNHVGSFTGYFSSTGDTLQTMLMRLAAEGENTQNPQVLAAATQALNALTKVRQALERMMMLRDFTKEAEALAPIDDLRKALEVISGQLTDEKNVKFMKRVRSQLEDGFLNAAERIAKETAQANDMLHKTMVTDAGNIAGEIKSLVDTTTKRANEIKGSTQATILFASTVVSALCIGALLFGVALIALAGRTIAAPIVRMTGVMQRLAAKDWAAEVPDRLRRDEVGAMARAVQIFKEAGIENERLTAEAAEAAAREAEAARERARIERANREAAEARMAEDLARAQEQAARAEEINQAVRAFERAIAEVVSGVASTAQQLQHEADMLSTTSDETTRQAEVVAASAEQASANVQTVAAATEQLASSSQEIGRQVQYSAEISSRAVSEAERTFTTMRDLNSAAARIGDVVRMIEQVAGQTNLLALNATIEAARAGEAGKGFAVVASEVKALATQTAKATEEITGQIGGIQAMTEQAVVAIERIGATIREMSHVAAAIASAVEQQVASTGEIARNVDQAACGTGEVSGGISTVRQAADQTGSASSNVLLAATELATKAGHLRSEVDQFLSHVTVA